jgi:hypothetical protein
MMSAYSFIKKCFVWCSRSALEQGNVIKLHLKMSDPSLFGAEGGGGGGGGGSTVTFNAGKCMFDSSTNTVTPIKEKGQVSFVQVREDLRVRAIRWKNRLFL